MLVISKCTSYDQKELIKSPIWNSIPKSVKSKKIFIKPNLVTPMTIYDCVSTTRIEVVSVLIEKLLDLGVKKIVVGDCGFKNQWANTCDSTGYGTLPKRYGIKLIGLQEGEDFHKFTLIRFPEKEDYLSLFGAKISDYVLECDAIISVPKMKIHKMARVTGSIKNLMGIMTNKGNMHPRGNADILHKRLRDLYFLLRDRVIFSVLDGIEGSEFSEQCGIFKKSNVLGISNDMWQLDVAMTKMMGINPKGVAYLEYIRRDLKESFDLVKIGKEFVTHYEEAMRYKNG